MDGHLDDPRERVEGRTWIVSDVSIGVKNMWGRLEHV